MDDVLIIEGARTAFGEYGGGLRDFTPAELGLACTKEALLRSGIDPQKVDNVIFGNVLQTAGDSIYLPRHISLRAGISIEATALIVSRICGSGLQAMVSAAKDIALGESEVSVAGGTESMSQAPVVVRGARWGVPMGNGVLDDYMWQCFTDTYNNLIMGQTAENLAVKFGITREEQDEFALRSQAAAAKAQTGGRFNREIVPLESKGKDKKAITLDEHIRPGLAMEKLAKLKARFREGGTVTPGNASGINDGAAALVLTSARRAEKEGVKPLARVLSWAVAGVDPDIMGFGPVQAIKKALARAGLTMDQIGLFEINEAFAAQYLAVEKALELDRSKVNVNGGAVALGHPLGASGARLTLTLLYEMSARNVKYGVASLCIGGGQGIAAVFENLN